MTSRRTRKRLLKRQRMKREREGKRIVPVPVDAVILNWLERHYRHQHPNVSMEDLDAVGK
ncbi:hypothetical protein [Bradyrhizobium sp. Leo121]|uniref:hypothetical protein n=1 Tax=Bradyrhizobium sp. Leo121 TaxID=1571195 RepID=UPI001029114D|nr:hypothetical protein [Bradyrhizobium sp. Leo121]RZN25578.1 hypothetical protein CWO90_27405 [Bradyrhizobium sp. Leo121]